MAQNAQGSAQPEAASHAHGHHHDISPPARNKTFANKLFNFVTYDGLGFAANSALSLAITWNVMPTETAKKGKAALSRLITPLAEGVDKMKRYAGLGKEVNAAERALHIAESSRSAAEILCMFVAGCIVLVPMKFLEDRKKSIVNRIDRWKNPEYHQYCEENHVKPEPLPCESEAKQTWRSLLGARLGGMAAVLGIDAAMQSFNNARMAKGKGNFDTLEWAAGGKAYDVLPKSFTKRVIDFFTNGKRADSTGLHNIQEQLLERLEHTVGSDKNKMLFAEQSRLVIKEISLTLIMAKLVYSLSKTGVMSKMLSKFGIKKAEDQKEAIDTMLQEVPFMPVTRGDVDLSDNRSNDRKAPSQESPAAETVTVERPSMAEKYASTRREKREIASTAQAGGYSQKIASMAEQPSVVQVGG